jgi:hypothetical protein
MSALAASVRVLHGDGDFVDDFIHVQYPNLAGSTLVIASHILPAVCRTQ